MAGTLPIRVLLVEDDRRIAEIIRDGLDPERFALGWAASVAQAKSSLAGHNYDIMVLDVGLPDGDGLSIAAQLREAGSHLPILVLTAHNTLADRMEGFRHGVDDYLCKPFAVEELCARLGAIVRRYQAGTSQALSYGDLKLDLVARKVRRRALEVTLSAREVELLIYFLRHSEQVLDRDRILAEVWGDEAEEDGNVLSVYVNYLRNKTEQGRYPRIIHTVRGAGYMLCDHEPEDAAYD